MKKTKNSVYATLGASSHKKTKGYRVEVKREPRRNYRMQEAREYVDSE